MTEKKKLSKVGRPKKKKLMVKKAPAKMGRPTKRNDGVINSILDGLSNGTPLTVICRSLKIHDSIVRDWMNADEQLSRAIAFAREVGFDVIAAEALMIADTPVDSYIEKTGKDGVEITKQDALGHRKLQVETRLKLLAKWDPKRYGDKPEIIVNNNNTAAGSINLGQQQEEQLAQLVAMARASAKKQVIDV